MSAGKTPPPPAEARLADLTKREAAYYELRRHLIETLGLPGDIPDPQIVGAVTRYRQAHAGTLSLRKLLGVQAFVSDMTDHVSAMKVKLDRWTEALAATSNDGTLEATNLGMIRTNLGCKPDAHLNDVAKAAAAMRDDRTRALASLKSAMGVDSITDPWWAVRSLVAEVCYLRSEVQRLDSAKP